MLIIGFRVLILEQLRLARVLRLSIPVSLLAAIIAEVSAVWVVVSERLVRAKRRHVVGEFAVFPTVVCALGAI